MRPDGERSRPHGLRRRSAPRNDGGWCQALAEFEAAEAELQAFERRTAGAPWEEQDSVERGMNERLDALYSALLRLLSTPAPGREALLTKIALIDDHEVGSLDGGERCLDFLMSDLRRLVARGQSASDCP